MGCWYATDCITGVPILPNDPVKLLILSPNQYFGGGCSLGSGVCYPYGMWLPVGPVISGEYNDYGCVENVTMDIAARYMHQALSVSEEGRERVQDYDESDIHSKLRAVERGVVTKPLPHDRDKEQMLMEWMVHDRTWNLLMDLSNDQWGHTERMTERVNNLKAMGESVVPRAIESVEDVSKVMEFRHLMIAFFPVEIAGENYFCDALEWAMSNGCFSDMVDRVAEIMKLYVAMSSIRRYLAPIAAAGSQNMDHENHIRLAQMVIEQCEEAVEKFEED